MTRRVKEKKGDQPQTKRTLYNKGEGDKELGGTASTKYRRPALSLKTLQGEGGERELARTSSKYK